MGSDRYGARRAAQPDPPDMVGADDDDRRARPAWLTGTVGAVFVVAVAGLAIQASADAEPPAPSVEPAPAQTERYGPAVTIIRNTPPPVAPLRLTGSSAEVWKARGFSYLVELTNPTSTAYDLLDVDHPVAGTEMVWDRTLVLTPGAATTVKIDFLVVNCAAVVNRAAPVELRLTLRPAGAEPGAAGGVAVLDLDLSAVSAAVAASGGAKCDATGPIILSAG